MGFPLCGFLIHEQVGIGNSPRTMSCGSGDRKVVHNGGFAFPSFDGSERLLQSSFGSKKRSKRSLVTSSCSSLASIVLSGGIKSCATACLGF
jgi:hypothetical protein